MATCSSNLAQFSQMNSDHGPDNRCVSSVIGLFFAIVVTVIVFIAVGMTAEEKKVTSEYGWTTTEIDLGPSLLISALSGLATWVVVALWVHSKLKGSPSTENQPDARLPVRRQPIPRWVKAHLFQACSGQCAGCLDTFRQIGNMQIDHIIPVHLGGTNELDNLQLLCRSCNVKKGTGTMLQLIERLRRDGIRR